MSKLIAVLHAWRWPLAVVVAVALASWAALEIAAISMELDPGTVAALAAIRGWAGKLAAGAGALFALTIGRDMNHDGIPDAFEKYLFEQGTVDALAERLSNSDSMHPPAEADSGDAEGL